MKRFVLFSFGAALGVFCSTLQAQVPQLIKYQGRVVVSTTNFSGAGQFQFAHVLVDGVGTRIYWNNNVTSNNDSVPINSFPISVTNELYSVLTKPAKKTS